MSGYGFQWLTGLSVTQPDSNLLESVTIGFKDTCFTGSLGGTWVEDDKPTTQKEIIL